MRYYPFTKNWRKVRPHLSNKKVQDVLVRDMNRFTFGRWRTRFTQGMLPEQVESCDWRWGNGRRGRTPAYWAYVKHAACHWLVNFNFELAKLVEPNKKWRILSGGCHSTVWDGEETLFDMNFSALGVDPNEAFDLANEEHYPIGKRMIVYYADHYSEKTNNA